MKNILLIILLFSSCTKAQVLGGKVTCIPKPLIIIAGESNAGGLGVNASLSTAEAATRYSLKIMNNNNLKFENLLIGTNNLILHQNFTDNSSHGFENGLANSGDSGSLGNTPVYLVKAGQGSSRIAWWNDSTQIYFGANAWQQLKTRVDSAKILMKAINGGIDAPLYLFWTQGINNAIDGTDPTAWKDSTKSFFTKFRLRYGASVPIVMTYLPTDRPTFNTAITTLIGQVTNCYALTVSDAALNGDGNHWSYAGLKLIAARFVATVKANYKYY